MTLQGALPLAQLEREAQLRDFRGRQALLGRLREAGEGFTLILGGPGTGKSALMAALSRALAAPYHFIRCHRDPQRFIPALFAQTVALLPGGAADAEGLRGQETWSSDDWRNALVSALARVVAHRGHAALVLDGVDELERVHELGAYLPSRLPPGARMFLSARPGLELVSRLRAELTPIELCAIPPLASSDLTPSTLPRRSLDAMVERTRGLPLLLFPALRRAEARGSLEPADIASSAHALFEALLAGLRRAIGPAATPLLSVLWAAREPITARDVHAVLSILLGEMVPDLPQVRAQLEAASELLRVDELGRVAFWHAAFTDYVGEELLGRDGRRQAHKALAAFSETSATPAYAESHLVAHLMNSEQHARARAVAEDHARMARTLAQGHLPELVADLSRAGSASLQIVRRHAALLAREPGALYAVLSYEGVEPRAATGPWLRTLYRPPPTTPNPSRILYEGAAEISDLALAPRGVQLATASHDGFVRIFDRASGAMVSALRVSSRRALSIAFDVDGRVVCGTDDGVLVVSADDRREERAARCAAPQWGVAVAPSGAVASAGRDGTLTLWDESLSPRWQGRVPFAVTSLAFTDDDHVLVATGARGGTAFVDLRADPARPVRIDEGCEVTTWGVTCHEHRVALCRHDGWLQLFACRDGQVRREHALQFPDEHLFAVAFLEGGKEIVCAGSSGHIHRLAVHRDGLLRMGSLRAHAGFINGLQAEPSRVWSVGVDGTIRAHDLAGWPVEPTPSDEPPIATATALALGASEREVVLGFDDGTIRFCDAEGLASPDAALRVADAAVSALAASQRLLLVGARDGTARLLRQQVEERSRKPRWKRLASLVGHAAEVTAAVFLRGPHQGLVATAGRDHAVRLSSVLGARLLAEVELPSAVVELSLAHDPALLGARCRDGVMRWLRLPSLAIEQGDVAPLEAADPWVLRSGRAASGRALGLRPDECVVFDGHGARVATAPVGFLHAVKAPSARGHEWLALCDEGIVRLALVESPPT